MRRSPFRRHFGGRFGGRFGAWSFYRGALSIALPVMLQQLITSMVSLIDNFMVAGLGDISMAAVNISNQLTFISIVMINVICGAGGIYLAQYKGANDVAGMRDAFRFKALFAQIAALFFFCLCWLIPEQMLGMMTTGNAAKAELVAAGVDYLKIVSFALFPMAFSMAIGSSFRETGSPRTPLLVSVVATLINTAGNWLLIYGNMGAPALGIQGAAVATVIARCVEAAVFLIYARRRRPGFYASLGTLLRVSKKLVREIFIRSVMMFLSEISWISSETIMVALYNGRGGAETVAGMAAGNTIANIFYLLFGGIWTVSAVIIGGSLGAGKLDEARVKARWIQSGSVVGGIVMAIIGAGLAVILVPLVFSNLTANARAIGLGFIFVILAYMPLWCLLNALFAISRSGGDAAMGMYADVSVNTLIFVPGAFLLAFFTSMGPVAMFAILKISDIAKYLVARHFFNKERWVRNLTSA
ncbi:MAG: polysaccharide biosynthesis C-terminal domain-containing protein [Treponema sp.]|nr:polysaccharide biosynthesis C-terminal domain-containing protein [Treponema sp.]